MERSHFLAKLIGPVFIAGGLGMLFNTTVYRAMFERALHDHMLIYLSGVLALVAGLAVVIMHNDWKWHWPLIITVLGWLALIGGIVRMIAPQVIESFGLSVLSYSNFFTIDGGIAVLLGVLLCYFGYLDPQQLLSERAPARRRSRLRRRR
ncbi:MAG TPA: hypothetical protein VFJ59_00375 [Pseudolabrys sp.]|jgi:hypothetical protein|nr:hypothetical protein [Pseudolabrys sp.]